MNLLEKPSNESVSDNEIKIDDFNIIDSFELTVIRNSKCYSKWLSNVTPIRLWFKS